MKKWEGKEEKIRGGGGGGGGVNYNHTTVLIFKLYTVHLILNTFLTYSGGISKYFL